jgi:hypothetical protein
VLIEQDAKYVALMREEVKDWLGKDASQVLTINHEQEED